ncbi:thioredoxin-disulfide reductase [Methanocella sp. CWC-04]|uniref:Thioredoxin-disulfide reductase n=1 Tax=Methanooceanicella nereidis TaxID=2052831 RepID=A0AAP2W783_9EURY|nr:FAD-dependent oxidoreductase [Methanocella sp. CWC-04]MCD1294959.1 thioredoxin-disulfide reductase [Methanocella sp. CWC-04]
MPDENTVEEEGLADTTYDVGIIGAGPAGMTAALYTGRANLKTVVFGNIFDSQLAKAGDVENYPGFDSIKGIELVERFNNQLGKYNVIQIPTYITRIMRRDDMFTLVTDNAKYRCRSVIIATGSKFKSLNIPGEKEFTYKGVSYCAVCDGSFYKNRKVALIGTGDHAAKGAIYLAGLCKDVVLLTAKADLETMYIDQVNAQPNITVVYNAKVTAIEGKDVVSQIKYIVKEEPETTIKVDGVFIEGGIPNSVLASELGLELDKKSYIIVNRPDHTTNIDGVFAAGDITGGIHQISKAVGEGACAAVSAAVYLKKAKARAK